MNNRSNRLLLLAIPFFKFCFFAEGSDSDLSLSSKNIEDSLLESYEDSLLESYEDSSKKVSSPLNLTHKEHCPSNTSLQSSSKKTFFNLSGISPHGDRGHTIVGYPSPSGSSLIHGINPESVLGKQYLRCFGKIDEEEKQETNSFDSKKTKESFKDDEDRDCISSFTRTATLPLNDYTTLYKSNSKDVIKSLKRKREVFEDNKKKD